MSDTPIIERIDNAAQEIHTPQNVHGWERVGSLAGGVLMMGKGLRRGGFFGLIQLAIGGAVLARGITGHCSAKSLIEKSRSDLDTAKARIKRAGDELSLLKNKAEVTAENVVADGIDALTKPKTEV
ncbi:YgaP family membrane protein [Pseudomonas sp. DSP3-2-2]|uniref:YgaP family membrane protein n=1 Tax=unclassified Pseudomonas TaxID=196821 RepID=UPI003CF56CD0